MYSFYFLYCDFSIIVAGCGLNRESGRARGNSQTLKSMSLTKGLPYFSLLIHFDWNHLIRPNVWNWPWVQRPLFLLTVFFHRFKVQDFIWMLQYLLEIDFTVLLCNTALITLYTHRKLMRSKIFLQNYFISGLVSLFNGISSFVGYFMPKPSL